MWFWRAPKILLSCGIVTVVLGVAELPGVYLEVRNDGIRVCCHCEAPLGAVSAAPPAAFPRWFGSIVWTCRSVWCVEYKTTCGSILLSASLIWDCLFYLVGASRGLQAWDASMPLLWRPKKAYLVESWIPCISSHLKQAMFEYFGVFLFP